MTNQELIQLGDLEAIRVPGKKDGLTVILFHGYGANAYDLAGLSSYILPDQGIQWIFPNGPIPIPVMPGYEGRAWFPIAIDSLQKAMISGDPAPLASVDPPGLEEAREKALNLIRSLDVPWSKVVIGGFSQGAMLSTDIMLREKENPAGLLVLSGTLLKQDIWSELAQTKKGFPFFQSHGIQDPVLPYSAAQKLNEMFLSSGMEGELVSFLGGHEIPLPAVQKMNEYLSRLQE